VRIATCAGLLPALTVAFTLTSCASLPVGDPDWVEPSNGRIGPLESNRVDAGRIAVLDGPAELTAVSRMGQSGVKLALLADAGVHIDDLNLPQDRAGKAGSWYLIRALGDAGGGEFSAFNSDAGVYIIFNRFGACTLPVRRVVAIRLDSPPVQVFAGCSGVL